MIRLARAPRNEVERPIAPGLRSSNPSPPVGITRLLNAKKNGEPWARRLAELEQ
jgi:hypothetical protein